MSGKHLNREEVESLGPDYSTTDGLPFKDGLNEIMPLSDCVFWLEQSGINVSERQLWRWAEEKRDNGFPAPAETLGKYKLWDVYDVHRWVVLWRKVSRNMGRGAELNGTRSES